MALQSNNLFSWAWSHWYVFLLTIAGVVIAYLLFKISKEGLKFHDEIGRHKEIVREELSYNPTDFKMIGWKMLSGFKPLGKIKGLSTTVIKIKIDGKKPQTKKELELYNIKKAILLNGSEENASMPLEKLEEIITMSVQIHIFDLFNLGLLKWYTGDAEIYSFRRSELEFDNANNRITIPSDANLQYRDGRFISTKDKSLMGIFVSDELWRTFHDHDINSMGWQNKRLSIMELGHSMELNRKEMDAEIEERKSKTLRER